MSWDEYLMGFAHHAATKSKDSTKVGAVLTSERRVLLTAYLTRLPCPCCGSRSSGRLALSDAGRLHLRTLRRRRAARLNCEA